MLRQPATHRPELVDHGLYCPYDVEFSLDFTIPNAQGATDFGCDFRGVMRYDERYFTGVFTCDNAGAPQALLGAMYFDRVTRF